MDADRGLGRRRDRRGPAVPVPGGEHRIIERRPGRLEIGQADGIQARSVETFQSSSASRRRSSRRRSRPRRCASGTRTPPTGRTSCARAAPRTTPTASPVPADDREPGARDGLLPALGQARPRGGSSRTTASSCGSGR
ncbi:hypothetical protein QJS66_13055 [Kocuria rhizophila]|nr:hypothetical protein QJS66_13055 [Kocuria rhizophila]